MPKKSERELDLEARVLALEYVLKQCVWNLIFLRIEKVIDDEDDEDDRDDLAIREVKSFRKLSRQHLKKAALRGAAPALSDHLFALVHDHVERVFEDIVREMGARRDRRLSRGNF